MLRVACSASVLVALAAGGCGGGEAPVSRADAPKAGAVEFHPVEHASFAITAPGLAVYVDPVGKPEAYAKLPPPDLILITHAHRDHLDPELLGKLRREGPAVIGSKEVIEQLKYGEALANGGKKEVKGVLVEAVPAYNTTKERLEFHPKGRDNGYVLALAGKRVYISGDTEDTPEMRALKDIDVAFVCMNLPYTMTVEQAASAVLEMKPKVVIPCHYRGKEGMSDLEKFKKLVAADPAIEVRLLKWYE